MQLEDQQVEQQQIGGGKTADHPGHERGIRRHADEDQHRRAEDDAEAAAGDEVVGGGGLEAGVDLAQQQHAGADGAGEHAEHGDQALVIVIRVDLFAHEAQVQPGDHAAGDGQQHEGQPQTLQVAQLDGGDARHDHDIEEEAGDAVEQIIVLILPPDHAGLAALLEQHAQEHCQRRADDEVEAPEQGIKRLAETRRDGADAGGEPPDGEVGRQVHEDHQRDLHRELVDRVGDGDLALALEVVRGELLLVRAAPGPELAPAREHIQDDDARDAGHEVARRRDREPEAAPAGEAQRLIARADVIGLAGALPVAHRQQQAGGLEERRHEGIGEQQRDQQAGDALDHVGADDDRAGLEPGELAALLLFLGRDAQAHGDETERDAVVDQDLHQLAVELHEADQLGQQQQEAGQHGDGHQASADEGELLAQEVCQQHGAGDETQLNDDVPQCLIGGRIVHRVPSLSYFDFQNSRYLRRFALSARS